MPYIKDTDGEDCSLEPIAICGMACRLPGAVDSASSLWELLKEKGSGQTPKVPKNRFNIDSHFHQNLERPGSFNVMGGYFLDGAPEDFDPTFFNMTPVEAMWLDPQQRKILEVSYECLESAGLTLDAVAGSNTAVFVGSFTSDYQQMSVRDTDFRHNYAATGVDPGIISNRIGNTFNLNGPSFTINTACSSSIYAIHNACHALRARDCEAAIAGGVNLILTVDQHMNTAKLGILSPTSTCHTFDASADGYGRAEGAGALYLKRLSDAIRDKDPIRSVIRSSAVNTNGKVEGMGITHPSVKGQERVVRAAYKRANLDPDKTAYLECHGTGTPVGDPIEVNAVSNAMNDTRSGDKPLLVGAIKANIGHSEAASGIFAVMKAAMMTEAATIPGVAGFKTINPAIDERGWNVKVNANTTPWPNDSPLRRASVSSFGYGGTNGHVIVEAVDSLYPWYEHGKAKSEARYGYDTSRPFLMEVSAHDKATLKRNIDAYGKVADKFYLSDLAYTLNTRRTKFSQRAFTVAHEGTEVEDFAVSSFEFGSTAATVPKIGYLFTGQGAQWAGMAVEAMQIFPSFLETIRELDNVLQSLEPRPSWTIEKVLRTPAESSKISDAEIAQPVCTAIQIAIVDLLQQWDITPSVTAGHSSGEIAAAYAAGLHSAPEAIIAAFYRGLAVKHAAPTGTMLAAGLGVEEISKYIADLGEDVVVACENSPSSVTLSGTIAGIQEAKNRLDTAKVFARELKTGKAYHSPQMSAVAPIYNDLLAQAYQRLDEESFEWRQPRARMISSVTGKEYNEDHVSIQYWSDNLRSRVRFDSAITTLGQTAGLEDVGCMIEIGPHSALAGPFKQICLANEYQQFKYIPTFVRKADNAVQLLKTAGELFLQGYPLDIEEVNRVENTSDGLDLKKHGGPRLLVDLPPYQWNYEKKFWAEPRFSHEQRHPKHPRHDLLGSRILGLSDHSLVWRNILRHRDLPWLKDHRLGNAAVFPAAAHMSLAIEALRQVHQTEGIEIDGVTLRDVDIKTALVIPEKDNGIEIQLRFQELATTEKATTWYSFAVESIMEDRWTTHCEGRIAANHHTPLSARKLDSPVDLSKLTQRVPGRRWYEAFNRVGFEYGPTFQPLNQIRTNGRDHDAAANVKVATESGVMDGESNYILHPSTIDACLQLIIVSINAGLHKEMACGVVPLQMQEVNLWFPNEEAGSNGHAVAWTDELNGRYFNTHTQLATESGELVLDVKSMRCVSYEAAVPQNATEARKREPYAEVSWKPDVTSITSTQAAKAYPDLQSEPDVIGKIIELLDHKSPLDRVLLLGESSTPFVEALKSTLPTTATLLVAGDSAEELEQLQSTTQDDQVSSILLPQQMSEWNEAISEPHDLVILGKCMLHGRSEVDLLAAVKGLVSENGGLISLVENASCEDFAKKLSFSGFIDLGLRLNVLDTSIVHSQLPRSSAQSSTLDSPENEVLIVSMDPKKASVQNIAKQLEDMSCTVHVEELTKMSVSGASKIIIDDLEGTTLSSLRDEIFDALKTILCSGSSIVWLTSGVIQGKAIFGGMSQGFLRAVRSEQAAAKIALLDIDVDESFAAIGQTLRDRLQNVETKNSGEDTEFWLHQGVVHVSRILPNDTLNDQFGVEEDATEESVLPAKTALGGKIVDGELSLCSSSIAEHELAADEVQIQVNASEFQADDLQSNYGTPRIVVGKILSVGNGVDTAKIGQVIVTYTNAAYSTIVRANQSMCVSAEGFDITTLAATLPNLCRAVNCTIKAGNVQGGAGLLVLPMPLPILGAIVGLSRAFGFRIMVVVNTEKEREECVSKLQVPSGSIYLAQEIEAIRSLVSGPARSGPSTVIADNFSPLSREIWRFMPAMGRFVLNDSPVDENPDAVPFRKGASLIPTGIAALYKQNPSSTGEILCAALGILREHRGLLVHEHEVQDISALKDVKTISESFASVKNGVVGYSYGESPVKIQQPTKELRFSSEATYLLVGCLGGLGRSLTTWMMEKGCKNFAFISRSGADKPEAAKVVELINDAGATAQVFRADATNDTDVAKVVSAISAARPIRGVVHAAMVLQDGMFENMTVEKFATAVNPKMMGAVSLHKALGNTDLDFFVMTSSISAVLGNPGQTNYSAGNSFLDALAWHRNQNGFVASSMALPMVLDVGVVAENENIETSLSRKGMYGIDEGEMLRGFETAMMQPKPRAYKPAAIGNAQIILGLEPACLAAALASEDVTDAYWYNDARLNSIRAKVEEILKSSTSSSGSGGDFVGSLKATVAEGPEAVIKAIALHIMKRCSSILMTAVEDFDFDGKSIAAYGLDSMIGAELRNWLFKEFGLDMGFQTLLAPTLTFKALSMTVGETLGVLKTQG